MEGKIYSLVGKIAKSFKRIRGPILVGLYARLVVVVRQLHSIAWHYQLTLVGTSLNAPTIKNINSGAYAKAQTPLL